MKHNYITTYNNIRLRPLEESDIELLRVWRNDKEQTAYLRKIPEITSEMQKNWFINSQNSTTEYVFAIEETHLLNRMVGSVAVYDIKNGTAEVGRIQIGDKEARGYHLGRLGLTIAMWFGFEVLNLNKILGTVHRENKAAYKNDINVGFIIVDEHLDEEGRVEYDLEINRQRLLEMNPFLNEIKFVEEY